MYYLFILVINFKMLFSLCFFLEYIELNAGSLFVNIDMENKKENKVCSLENAKMCLYMSPHIGIVLCGSKKWISQNGNGSYFKANVANWPWWKDATILLCHNLTRLNLSIWSYEIPFGEHIKSQDDISHVRPNVSKQIKITGTECLLSAREKHCVSHKPVLRGSWGFY